MYPKARVVSTIVVKGGNLEKFYQNLGFKDSEEQVPAHPALKMISISIEDLPTGLK